MEEIMEETTRVGRIETEIEVKIVIENATPSTRMKRRARSGHPRENLVIKRIRRKKTRREKTGIETEIGINPQIN